MSSFLYERPLARKQKVMTQLNNLHMLLRTLIWTKMRILSHHKQSIVVVVVDPHSQMFILHIHYMRVVDAPTPPGLTIYN